MRNQTLTAVALLPLAGALLLLAPQVKAKTETIEYQVVLTVTRSPCILAAQSKSVDFGSVISDSVEGDTYQQDLKMGVSCPTVAKNMFIKFATLIPADWDSDLIASGVDNLGIQLRDDNDGVVEIGKEIRLSGNNLPNYKAVLVQKRGEKVGNGTIAATATVTLEYE